MMNTRDSDYLNNNDIKKVEQNVTVLGWVAFFGGMAQDMIQPILPIFYSTVLGLNKEFIGLIEGILTTVVSLAKIGAGYISDIFGVRKAIVFVGYSLSAFGRFFISFVPSGALALVCRSCDGLGKGLKDAPRDALVASSAGSRKLGLAFGIQRMLDTFGSVVGPLITFLLLKLLINHTNRYRIILMIAGLIATIPLLLIGFWVKERKIPIKKQSLSLSILKGPFLGFLIVILLFTLGNSSDMFIILRAQNVGFSVVLIPIVYAVFNLVSAVTAVPAGKLADKVGRRKVIAYGWCIYAFVYAGLSMISSAWMIWPLYALYGLFYSLTEGSSKALVAEFVSDENRGAAYGLYSAAVGIMALPASMIAGLLWNHISPAAPFGFGALMAGIAFIGLVLLPEQNKSNSN
jgi:MFS family permease